MKTFKETIYFNREKEENWGIVEEAVQLGFTNNTRDFLYIGYEVGMEINVCENGEVKVLSINGIDVQDKDICIN